MNSQLPWFWPNPEQSCDEAQSTKQQTQRPNGGRPHVANQRQYAFGQGIERGIMRYWVRSAIRVEPSDATTCPETEICQH